jgi:YHS domain-containing protein
MKSFNRISRPMIGAVVLAAAFAAVSFTSTHAEDTNAVASVKPDRLTTCPVSGDKLGGDMGKPYVMVYQGQEVKFCCPMCKKDFDKDPAKYIAKIRAADAPDKK